MADPGIDLELAPSERPTGSATRSNRRTAAVVAVASVLVVLAVVAVLLAIRPDGGKVDVAIDETTTSTTAGPDAPDVQPAPAPIIFGAADDGKASVGLPVTADPSTGLVDGQTVTVTGTGFPQGESIGVVMCAREAGSDYGGRGVEACNIGRYASGAADADGRAVVSFAVRRTVVLDGQEIDCASETGRCIIGMGMISDYDQSGGVAIDFDPSAPLPDPPSVVLKRTAGLVDGEAVPTRLTGLVPGTQIFVSECTAADTGCVGVAALTADADGTFDGFVRLWRSFGVYVEPFSGAPPNVDCAVADCVVRFDAQAPGDRAVPTVPVAFDPASPGREPPTVDILTPEPFRVGTTVEIDVGGVATDSFVDVTVCDPTAPDQPCYSAQVGPPRDGVVRAQLPVDSALGRLCSGDGCVLRITAWDNRPGEFSSPPPLFPAPRGFRVVG